jgi:ribosome-associated protein
MAYREQREDLPPEGPSKSQVKRELRAFQNLAERVVAMPRGELELLGLSEPTRSAVDETARIRDQRARRRHLKRIAKLLAAEDIEAVRSVLDKNAAMARELAARHHRAERWRERLIEEGDDALTELLGFCPRADRQRLRQLMRAARRDAARGRVDEPRKLFRFLRDLLDEADLD